MSRSARLALALLALAGTSLANRVHIKFQSTSHEEAFDGVRNVTTPEGLRTGAVPTTEQFQYTQAAIDPQVALHMVLTIAQNQGEGVISSIAAPKMSTNNSPLGIIARNDLAKAKQATQAIARNERDLAATNVDGRPKPIMVIPQLAHSLTLEQASVGDKTLMMLSTRVSSRQRYMTWGLVVFVILGILGLMAHLGFFEDDDKNIKLADADIRPLVYKEPEVVFVVPQPSKEPGVGLVDFGVPVVQRDPTPPVRPLTPPNRQTAGAWPMLRRAPVAQATGPPPIQVPAGASVAVHNPAATSVPVPVQVLSSGNFPSTAPAVQAQVAPVQFPTSPMAQFQAHLQAQVSPVSQSPFFAESLDMHSQASSFPGSGNYPPAAKAMHPQAASFPGSGNFPVAAMAMHPQQAPPQIPGNFYPQAPAVLAQAAPAPIPFQSAIPWNMPGSANNLQMPGTGNLALTPPQTAPMMTMTPPQTAPMMNMTPPQTAPMMTMTPPQTAPMMTMPASGPVLPPSQPVQFSSLVPPSPSPAYGLMPTGNATHAVPASAQLPGGPSSHGD